MAGACRKCMAFVDAEDYDRCDGCGKFFCGEHLYVPPDAVFVTGGGWCFRCQAAYRRLQKVS